MVRISEQGRPTIKAHGLEPVRIDQKSDMKLGGEVRAHVPEGSDFCTLTEWTEWGSATLL